MLFPDYNEFARLARTATLVPVAKTVAADLRTPVSAFLSIAADEPNAFLLESVEGGEKIGRYTFLGARPYMILRARGRQISIERHGKKTQQEGDIFKILDGLLREHTPAHLPGLPPFTAGAVGFFAHDAVRQIEKLPELAKDDLQMPDCNLMFFDRLLAFDHVRHEIFIIATADVRTQSPRQAYALALRDIARIEKKLAAPLPAKFLRASKPKTGKVKVAVSVSKKHFIRTVEKIKEYIMAGDVFQAVPSLRLELEPDVEPLNIYRALRRVNPSPYMYFLRMGEMTVLGSSPEMLVRVTGRKLEYRPIAGTRKRGKDEAEDLKLEDELRNDEKERAEHIMLVDLGRNDVGRVSEFGSVKVRDLMFVERYSHVMHLVSAVEGTLRAGLTPIDALSSCFPAGTLTGAPKVRAMEIIEEVEPVRRGIYGGSVLYADFAGNLDSCIAIRTMLVKGKKAYVQAGAGIVADSVPESEYQECLNKTRALVRAVELARSGE
ncbi:MAG TPA: anthranilate synthase component I [Candidatus Angelobacter sp.]|jgi:anthranilate synthase component 1|nr:anthranilate synthase component I [Candidatus Angelobacter sp.]